MFAFSFTTRFHTSGFIRRSLPIDRILLKGGWLLMFGLLAVLLPRHAEANLMLNPVRIVFENNQRAAQVDLINNGAETATFRIRLVNRRMSETGEFTVVDSPAPGEQFADGLLRYSPRQVVLAPGAGQAVRLMLRKPASLAPGEYRSHLMFEKVPESQGATSIETQGSPAGDEFAIKLTALIGASIPIIVRHGDTAATVTLSHLALQKSAPDQAPVLALQMERSGNRSVYGDLAVSFTPHGGAEQVIGKVGGIAVYTPNHLRRAKLALQVPPGLVLAHGSLRVTYRERPDNGGKLLAEAALVLP